jgi:hypothetical protein
MDGQSYSVWGREEERYGMALLFIGGREKQAVEGREEKK